MIRYIYCDPRLVRGYILVEMKTIILPIYFIVYIIEFTYNAMFLTASKKTVFIYNRNYLFLGIEKHDT